MIARVRHLMGQTPFVPRSEEHTSELQSQSNLVCRLLLEKKKFYSIHYTIPQIPPPETLLSISPSSRLCITLRPSLLPVQAHDAAATCRSLSYTTLHC